MSDPKISMDKEYWEKKEYEDDKTLNGQFEKVYMYKGITKILITKTLLRSHILFFYQALQYIDYANLIVLQWLLTFYDYIEKTEEACKY